MGICFEDTAPAKSAVAENNSSGFEQICSPESEEEQSSHGNDMNSTVFCMAKTWERFSLDTAAFLIYEEEKLRQQKSMINFKHMETPLDIWDMLSYVMQMETVALEVFMNFIKTAGKRALISFRNTFTRNRRYEIKGYIPACIKNRDAYYLVRPVYGIQIKEELFYGYSSPLHAADAGGINLYNFEHCIKSSERKELCGFTIPELSKITVIKILDSGVAVVCCSCTGSLPGVFYVPVSALYGSCPAKSSGFIKLTVYGPSKGMLWEPELISLINNFDNKINEYKDIIYVSLISLFLYTKDGCAESFIYGVRDVFERLYNSVLAIKSDNLKENITAHEANECILEMIKYAAGFMKNLLESVRQIDGFQMYDGMDIPDLFEHYKKEKYQKEQESRKAHERKRAGENAKYITDAFIKQIESRNNLLEQFNKD